VVMYCTLQAGANCACFLERKNEIYCRSLYDRQHRNPNHRGVYNVTSAD
jgi:hypothetical protein